MALTRLKISPTGMRLHEWVALERGFFQDEGIVPETLWEVVLGAIEECRVRQLKLIPADIWRRIVHLLGQLEGGYTEKLGIDRSVERTAEVLFEAQEALMLAARSRWRGRAGNVIPLFRRR